MKTAQQKNDHAELGATFNEDEKRVDWHDKTLWFVREKRDMASRRIPQWEDLREQASNIKMNVLDNLHTYLLEFEKNALANGVMVHWASTPAELNERVLAIIRDSGETKLVKSKSMLTEECHLNEYLTEQGIEVIDTDLGERIVQLAGESPSHIVLPCIHKKKEEIGQLFHRHLGTEAGNSDPVYLTSAARSHLRKHFLSSRVAITGVNFAVAETGEIVVCTNEGNADLGVQLADVHIACMGIEKIIPRRNHLSVFLRLLARSATGQPITTYSSHFCKARPGQVMHIVLLDNGRSQRLGDEDFRSALKCIRCGACMNTCPVYRRSGGHSYHTTIAGPIGSILAPGLDMKSNADLPFASTLCGSCSNVCPVKIDIHNQLYKWRQVIVKNGQVTASKKVAMKGVATVLASYGMYKWAGAGMRWVLRHIPLIIENRFNPWSKRRDLPEPPQESFQSWYAKNKKNG